jgi:transposase-like protein
MSMIDKILYKDWNKDIHICKICGKEWSIANGTYYSRLKENKPIDTCAKCMIAATNIEKYGCAIASQSKLVKDKTANTNIEKYGGPSPTSDSKIRERQIKTCQEKYGGISSLADSKVTEKIKNTMLERYGVEHPLENKDIRDKMMNTVKERDIRDPEYIKEVRKRIEKTNLERYNSKSTLLVPEVIEKIKNTNLKLYGYENPIQNEEVKKKAIDTMISRYGVKSMLALPEIREKGRLTNIRKYGASSNLSTPETKEKIRKTVLEKYGCSNVLQNEEIRKKAAETNLKKYGSETPGIIIMAKSLSENLGASKKEVFWLKKVAELFKNGVLKDKGYELIIDKQKITNTVNRRYDAMITKDGNVDTVIEYDGVKFHGDFKYEYDGVFAREEYDENRSIKLPEGIKFFILHEHKEEESIAELVKMLGYDYEGWVKYQFDWCKTNGFPYYKYTDEELKRSYDSLIKYKRTTELRGRPGIGDNIINNFHHSIYKSRVEGHISPYEAYHDDSLLKKCIENRFIYIDKVNPRKILQGFNINKIAPKVSVFSAALAKLLISEHLDEFDTIFDPFTSFSGRLLGTTSLGKKYIGQEINPIIAKESNDIIKYFNLNATVICKDIMNSTGVYDCLFTRPPYGERESTYVSDGKYIKTDITSEKWVDICLDRFKCKKYLFIIDDKDKKYDSYMVDTIRNKSHFGSNYEKVILIEK